jgi:putative transposase
MVSAQARLEQVRYAVQRGLSQRRACALMRAARSGLHYDLRMPVKDAPVIEAMKDLSGQFPRFGARRIHVFLERQGIEIGVGTGAAASGALPACRCRPGRSDAGTSHLLAHGPCRQRVATRCGATTSCLTPVPMGSS